MMNATSAQTFSNNLLNAAEGYGVYLSSVLDAQSNGTASEMIIVRDNIGECV